MSVLNFMAIHPIVIGIFTHNHNLIVALQEKSGVYQILCEHWISEQNDLPNRSNRCWDIPQDKCSMSLTCLNMFVIKSWLKKLCFFKENKHFRKLTDSRQCKSIYDYWSAVLWVNYTLSHKQHYAQMHTFIQYSLHMLH